MADDITKAAREAKQRYRDRGYEMGLSVVEDIKKMWAGDDDPYLVYLWCVGVAQAIENHGRDIAGLNRGKSRWEPEGRKK